MLLIFKFSGNNDDMNYSKKKSPRSEIRALKREKKNLQRRLRRQQQKHKEDVSKYKKIIKEIEDKNSTESIDQILEKINQDFPEQTSSLFCSQIRIAQSKSKNGRRWAEKDKTLAISLYYQSPRAYKFLSRTRLLLPCPRTINRWLQGLHFQPGYQSNIMDVLKSRVAHMTEMEKVCSILIDEISIKEGLTYDEYDDRIVGLEDFGFIGRSNEVANMALVVMIRGIASNWKQPLCYFLSRGGTGAEKLTMIIKETIQRLSDIGLNVKACVCDQGVHNRGMFGNFQITPEKPYWETNGNKIYFLYDTPHLLKSVRNNLKSHDISVDGKIAKWSHIEKFYQMEQARGHTHTKGATKLTNDHIYLSSGFKKMSVKRATQVLSATVAANMYTCVANGTLPPEAIHTAEFCDKFDQLFDSVNSIVLNNGKKPINSAVTATSNHIMFWNDMKCWIQNFKCKSLNRIACFDGWILSLSALQQLWQDLSANHHFRFLFTKYLNQDPLENLFSVVRYRGGCNDNPNSEQFKAALKAATIHHIAFPTETTNCEKDDGYFLVDLLNQIKIPPINKMHTATSSAPSIPVASTSFADLPSEHNLPEKNILAYIAGYLCFRILRKHSDCNICCKHLVRTDASLDDPSLLFMYFKGSDASGKDFGNLTVPSHECITFIQKCDHIFIEEFNQHYGDQALGLKLNSVIAERVQGTESRHSICDSTYYEIIRLFVRMRIFNVIKQFNRKLRGSERKNRKYLKVCHL